MPRLPKYTLEYDDKKKKWSLDKDKTGITIKTFKTKEDATLGGVLKKTLGLDGGSVKIQKVNGEFQEERTFPKSKDPRKSRG